MRGFTGVLSAVGECHRLQFSEHRSCRCWSNFSGLAGVESAGSDVHRPQLRGTLRRPGGSQLSEIALAVCWTWHLVICHERRIRASSE